jgi:hypothetical protein
VFAVTTSALKDDGGEILRCLDAGNTKVGDAVNSSGSDSPTCFLRRPEPVAE